MELSYAMVIVEQAKKIEKQMKEIDELRQALDCLLLYWDEWADAPDDDPFALSLEEVVNIARNTLKELKNGHS